MMSPIHNNKRVSGARRVVIAGGLSILTGLGLGGCARDTSDLERYIADIKSRPSAPIEPIPEMKPFDTFVYPEDLKRDPFVEPKPERKEAAIADGPRPDPSRPREALEDFPLDSLRMMGTLQQNGRLWALIRDPDGTIHRVETGNYLGQNHGRVVTINNAQVELVELVRSGQSGWIERTAALAIKE